MDTNRELVELKELVQENHKILKKMQTRARIGTAVHTIKWVVIILVALGVYSFIQPFLEGLAVTYTSLRDAATTIAEVKANVPSTDSFNLLNLLKK